MKGAKNTKVHHVFFLFYLDYYQESPKLSP